MWANWDSGDRRLPVALEDGVDTLCHECLGGLVEFDAEHPELLVRGRVDIGISDGRGYRALAASSP